MTDTTTEQAEEAALTPEEAEQQLAKLEQKVIDGEDVTPADLTAAEEKIKHARLFQRGREVRAEKKRLADAEANREAAKVEARGVLDGMPEDVLGKFDAAMAAMQALIDSIGTYDRRIAEVFRIFRRGGVPDVHTRERGAEHDTSNFALISDGEELHAVTVAGKMHTAGSPAEWVRQAVARVARANAGLPFRNGGDVEKSMGETRNAPVLLDQRDQKRRGA